MRHSLQGVMSIYNQAEYADERTDALQLWAGEVEKIVAEN